MIGRKSQCSNCGDTFVIQKETQVLFCQEACEHGHDLFKEGNHPSLRVDGIQTSINHDEVFQGKG